MSLHIWRNIYYYAGWEYKPTETTEKIKRDRHEVMVQIRSYGDNIKDIVLLREEGEVRENESDLIDNITDYTRLFEGVDIPPKKKKRRRRRNKSNNYSF